MEHAVDLSVPLTVEMDSAENWLVHIRLNQKTVKI